MIALIRRRRSVPALVVPGADEWHAPGATPSTLWPIACAYLGVALLIVAMARPQVLVPLEDNKKRGYDLIIAIDLSTSMYAEDFQRGAETIEPAAGDQADHLGLHQRAAERSHRHRGVRGQGVHVCAADVRS